MLDDEVEGLEDGVVAEHVREAAAGVGVFAFFAAAWFGWAQDEPPASWRRPLVVASIGSVLLAVVGGLLTWQRWSDASVFDTDGAGTGQRFGIVVGIEVVLAGGGAAVLSRMGRSRLTPPWIAFVVGVHFVPLGSLLAYPGLYAVAVAAVGVSLAAVPLARTRSVAISAVTGVGLGSVLLLAALASLVDLLTSST